MSGCRRRSGTGSGRDGELPVGRFPAPSERVALDVRIDEVVLRALEGEPARRYQHVREVRDDLGASAAAAAPIQDTSRTGASVVRRRPGHARRAAASSEPSRRIAHPDRVLWVALALIVLLYALALVSLSSDDGPAERSISATPERTP